MTSSGSPTLLRRLLNPLIIALVLALASLGAWAVSSPVGSSPDDDFHLASIWCAAGNKADACAPAADPLARSIPKDIVVDVVCFANNPSKSAACQGADFGTNPADLGQTKRGNFQGLYPPVYYLAMSVFVGPNVELSVVAMRIANSVLFVGLVSVLYWLLPRHRRTTLLLSLVISVVPLGLFLIASVNPSGWAILSAGTLWIALLGYFESSGRKRIGLAVIATLATIIGAGARADAAMYAGIAIATVFILTFRRSRGYLVASALPVALGVLAVAFFLSAGQASAASTGLSPAATGKDPTSFGTLLRTNLLGMPDLFAGVFGRWPLGWLDTPMPAVVWVAGLLVFCGAAFAGLGVKYPRKNLAAVWVASVYVAVPTILLIRSQAVVGEEVQPRYTLPLLVILAGVLLLAQRPNALSPSRAQATLAIVALSIANAVALHTNIARYVTGLDKSTWNLDARVDWWWNTPFSPMTVWIAGSLAFAGMLVAIARSISTSASASVAPPSRLDGDVPTAQHGVPAGPLRVDGVRADRVPPGG